MSNVVVFSTNDSLHIEFVTKSGRPEATKKTYYTYDEKAEPEDERRGFNATFEISDSFFNLGQLTRSTTTHLLRVGICLANYNYQ